MSQRHFQFPESRQPRAIRRRPRTKARPQCRLNTATQQACPCKHHNTAVRERQACTYSRHNTAGRQYQADPKYRTLKNRLEDAEPNAYFRVKEGKNLEASLRETRSRRRLEAKNHALRQTSERADYYVPIKGEEIIDDLLIYKDEEEDRLCYKDAVEGLACHHLVFDVTDADIQVQRWRYRRQAMSKQLPSNLTEPAAQRQQKK